MLLVESIVESSIRKYLIGKGWTTTNLPRTIGAHGADIMAYHPSGERYISLKRKGKAIDIQYKKSTIHSGNRWADIKSNGYRG